MTHPSIPPTSLRLIDNVLFSHDHPLKTFLHRAIERLGSFNGRVYELLPLSSQDSPDYSNGSRSFRIADRLRLKSEPHYWKILATFIQVMIFPLCIVARLLKGPLRHHAEAQLLKKRLEEWASQEGGLAPTAVRKIHKVFKKRSGRLNLSDLKLRSLPNELFQVTCIDFLVLSNNQLESIPAEISQMTNVWNLCLDENKLRSIPIELSQLPKLKELYLGKNQLQTLPAGLQFQNLYELDIVDNPDLCDLPLSLGHCSALTSIFWARTSISQININAIEEACRQRRDELCEALGFWRRAYWHDSDSLRFIDDLPMQKKQTLNEWILRLERARDFNLHQQELCQIMKHLVEYVGVCEKFAETFFAQAEANNEECGDRAAMALNELFVAWKIEALSEGKEASWQEKLELMRGIAKTSALRAVLQQLLSKRGSGTAENVEIYLYYETLLREKLGLVTAVHSMRYAKLGACSWIDESELIEKVNQSYLDHLVGLNLFKSMVENREDFQLEKRDLLNPLNALLDSAEAEKNKSSEGAYKEKVDGLKASYETSLRNLYKVWAERLLRGQNSGL